MDAIESVSEIGAGQSLKTAAVPGEAGDVALDAASLWSVEMIPPGGAVQSSPVSFGDKVWSNLDHVSLQMKEVQESLKTSLTEPVKAPEFTGDMLVDMRNTMVGMQGQQTQLLAMQMKLNESGSVFAVGLGMIQSAQHSARTLLQDK